MAKSSPLTGAVAGHFLIDLYTPVLPIILPLLIESMGLSYLLAGLVVTVFNIVSSITQPLVGIWGDRTGKHADVAFCVLLGAVGISLSVLTSNYLILLMLVCGAAIGHALFHPAAMDLVYRVSPPASLGKYNSIFTTAGSISYAFGPLVAGALIALGGLPAVCWMVLPGIIGAAWIFKLTRKTESLEPAVKKARFSSVEGSRSGAALVVTVCALRAIGYTGVITYLPTLLTVSSGMGTMVSSIIVTVMLLFGVAGQLAGGRLSDLYGRKRMLVFGLVLAIPCFMLIFADGWLMLFGVMSYAFFASFCYVTSVTMTQELLPGKTGLASGLTLGFTMGVGGLGAAAVGFAADVTGNLSGALSLMIVPILIAPVIALFVRYRKADEAVPLQ
ncbi:MAG: MFS transporter [Methanocorpusculum parvum]|nr:MFS transporter [Methanocorpusculum parvum]